MKKNIELILETWKTLLGSLLKWMVLSLIIGCGIGFIGGIFAHCIQWATVTRQGQPLLVLGLPAAGLFIVFMYNITGQGKNAGTNMVLTMMRSDNDAIPGQMTPLILISTVITHLFGGSSGREGAAIQFGASVGDVLARRLRLNKSDEKIVILASVSAAFAALFGTPMAAAIFSMEVISVGIMYYAALVPCTFSAFTAYYVAMKMGVHQPTPPFLITVVPEFYGLNALKCVGLAIVFALAGVIFCIMLHHGDRFLRNRIPNPYWRAFAGGCAVAALYFILWTDAYLGLGTEVIHQAFLQPAQPYDFILKMVFTCLTICAGFKGGEIVPSLFVGATLGSAVAGLSGMPINVCAACGMIGVFCAVTNSPITSLLIGFELFGYTGMPYYCTVVVVCYLISGYHGLYLEQHIVYSKTENKYVDRHTL